jgi:hypothetical protein
VIFASALFLALTFVALARRLGLFTRPFEVAATSQQAYRVLTDSTLNDDVKEAMMRQSATALVRQFVFISAASLVAVAAPLAVVWVLAALGLVPLKGVVEALLSWQILLSSMLLVTARTWLERGRVLGTR